MCVLRLLCDGVEAHEELVQRLEQLLRLLCDRVASLRGRKAVLRSLFRAPRLNARAVKTGSAAECSGVRVLSSAGWSARVLQMQAPLTADWNARVRVLLLETAAARPPA